jgi:amino acid transporter/nucleotide-binding universal stress UspA family protein
MVPGGSPTDNSSPQAAPGSKRKSLTPGQVLVVTSVMFTFISYWRTAAIVLCDLASTAYYIGGIVESQIGKAAPWFILAVMVFSYFVRMVYIESCSMFVRGGVYRIVKEAIGIGPAKLAVSALMFDYILTGPISGVTAGQYVIGLLADLLGVTVNVTVMELGSAAVAIAVTLYFWRVNTKGIHESSDKALKIMGATTVMAVIMIVWCALTLAVHPEKAVLPTAIPDLSRADQPGSPKIDLEGKPIPDAMGHPLDPLGFLGRTALGDALRPGHINWLSLMGVLGIFVAFGHSILAMSGEETLAQVYREVESPKLQNFKKAAFVVFVYSLLLTSLISFLAVMIIPDELRMGKYSGNLIGGLAMNVIGPYWARIALNALVVGVGFLILSGAVNTSIIGSNGVLNRVAEDGVMPDWFLLPHPRFGTSYRVVNLVVVLQVFTIVASRGKVLVLGEAYAFGVVWSFVFNALSMLVLRFKKPGHREYEVPLNVKVRGYEVPVGIALVFAVLAVSAVVNFVTKEVATVSGVIFTVGFFGLFTLSERRHRRRSGRTADQQHEHLEQFNQATAAEVTPASLGITKPYRKLVAIRSPHNLSMLEKCLAETDADTTDVVVMTAALIPPASADYVPSVTESDRALLTAVVNMAEHAGKPVKPLIVPTNEPIYALVRTAYTIGAQELIMGASNKYDPSDQLDQAALYWLNMSKGETLPLTVRVLSKDRDVRLDIAGGSQIPRAGERSAEAARTLAELRASWHGIKKLLLAYDGSSLSCDFLDTVLSFLDPAIEVTLIDVSEKGGAEGEAEAIDVTRLGVERALELGRAVDSVVVRGEAGPAIVQTALEGRFDAIFMSLRGEYRALDTIVLATNTRYVLQHAPCRVILGFAPKSIQPAAQGEAAQEVAR